MPVTNSQVLLVGRSTVRSSAEPLKRCGKMQSII
nr:MAG TPA: hypothetical protein [Caudoviricetes sp.]